MERSIFQEDGRGEKDLTEGCDMGEKRFTAGLIEVHAEIIDTEKRGDIVLAGEVFPLGKAERGDA